MILLGVELEILIYDSHSLKYKRSIIKSMIERMQQRYRVSASETGEHDMLNIGKVGYGIVSNSRQHADKVLRKVLNEVEEMYPIEILSIEWIESY